MKREINTSLMTSKEPFHITVSVPDDQWATEAGSATLCGAKSEKLLRYQFAANFMKVKGMIEPLCHACFEKYEREQDKK